MNRETALRREMTPEVLDGMGEELSIDDGHASGSGDLLVRILRNYGIYTTRHPNYFMARVVVPAGVLTTSQVRGLAKIIEAYAQGRLCLTTRQAPLGCCPT